MQIHFSAADLAAIVQPIEVKGTSTATITGIAALRAAGPGDLSFLGNPKYKTDVAASKASVVLVPADFAGTPAAAQQFLLVANPSAALAAVCARIEQALWPRPEPGIHASAVVDPTAIVAPSATIGPLCVVEAGAVIGERSWLQAQVFVGREARIEEDCWLMPGVRLMTLCELHRRVRLHPGVVIGGDGFGYEFEGGKHVKVPQIGRVVIEADVEIGSNSTIDRARFGCTAIGEGTKIDNLVQIAHNCVIGRHCLICAQVGISGSSTLEDYVVLGGQVGVGGHITIGQGVKAGGQAGITSNLEAGQYVNGTPAIPYMLERRVAVLQRRLPDLFRNVEELHRELERLKKSSAL